MKTRKVIGLISASAVLASCSESIHVPIEHYAVKTYMGEVKQVIPGPGTTSRKPFLEQIVTFPRQMEISVTASDGMPIRLSLEVTEPADFYKLCMGRPQILVQFWERRIEQLPREEATALLLKWLNGPDSGIIVKLR